MEAKQDLLEKVATAIRSVAEDPKEIAKRRAILRSKAIEDKRLSKSALIVFDRLDGFTDWKNDGYCDPTYEAIADGRKGAEPIARRSVANAIELLDRCGYIVKKKMRLWGAQAANRYYFPRLVPECKSECNSQRREPQDKSAKQNANLGAIPGAHCLHSQEEVVPEERTKESPLTPP